MAVCNNSPGTHNGLYNQSALVKMISLSSSSPAEWMMLWNILALFIYLFLCSLFDSAQTWRLNQYLMKFILHSFITMEKEMNIKLVEISARSFCAIQVPLAKRIVSFLLSQIVLFLSFSPDTWYWLAPWCLAVSDLMFTGWRMCSGTLQQPALPGNPSQVTCLQWVCEILCVRNPLLQLAMLFFFSGFLSVLSQLAYYLLLFASVQFGIQCCVILTQDRCWTGQI